MTAVPPSCPSRRDMLRAGTSLTVAGVGVTLLSGCGGGGDKAAATSAPPALSDKARSAILEAVKGGKVDVGKAVILKDADVILGRPTADSYVALGNTCPHQGGKVSEISPRGLLRCPLHGSEFDPTTGAVKVGPSNKPLPTTKLTVTGDKVETA